MQPDKPDFGINLDLSEFEDDAGQGAANAGSRLRRPDPETARRLQSAGQDAGFVRREADPAPVRLSRVNVGATTTLYLRVSPDDFNRFVLAAGAAGLGRADFLLHLLNHYERTDGGKQR